MDTSAVVAGFDPSESVDTPREMAGFDPRRPRPATATPAAFKYPLAVSRRTPVATSMRLSGQPSRPSAHYLLPSLVAQDVNHPGGGSRPPPPRQRLGPYPLMAGFQVSINGRFWVSTEVTRALVRSELDDRGHDAGTQYNPPQPTFG